MIIYNSQVLEVVYPTWIKSFQKLAEVVKATIDLHYDGDIHPYMAVHGDKEILLQFQESENWAASMTLGNNDSIDITGWDDSAEIDTNLFIHVIQATIDLNARTLLLFRDDEGSYFGYGLTHADMFVVESMLVIKRDDFYISADSWADGIISAPRTHTVESLEHKRKLTIPKEENDAQDNVDGINV